MNHGEDSLTVTTLRPIRAGDEVLNYYGPLGNGELLRRYGYVTDRHARHDVTEISWDLIVSVLKEALILNEETWGKAVCNRPLNLVIASICSPVVTILTGRRSTSWI